MNILTESIRQIALVLPGAKDNIQKEDFAAIERCIAFLKGVSEDERLDEYLNDHERVADFLTTITVFTTQDSSNWSTTFGLLMYAIGVADGLNNTKGRSK